MKRWTTYLRRGGLICCVLVITSWAGSCAFYPLISYAGSETEYYVAVARGVFHLTFREVDASNAGSGFDVQVEPADGEFIVPWFSLSSCTGKLTEHMHLDVPLWSLLVVIGPPTAYLLWRNRKCIPPGHCRTCGYNLTGNVSGVCPECGETL